MAGLGRFKLTDALPPQAEPSVSESVASGSPAKRGKGKSKGKAKAKGTPDQTSAGHGQAADQLREARESAQARNAEASSRDRMVDIGRGNQQAGRQRSGGGK
jgi:hypothetical protein